MRQARPALIVLVVVAVLLGGAAYTGYTVDRHRTDDLRNLLREADRLAAQPPSDDPLEYFVVHNHLAAAADVDACSDFALRMSQRFFPEGWHFRPQDVAAVKAGREVPAVHVVTGEPPDVRWDC